MKWWFKLTGCVALACILLTACTSNQPSAKTPVQEDEIAEEGQTLTVINPEPISNAKAESSVDEGKKYQIQTRLTDFKLLSETTGLAWGATRNELRLYLTQDRGKTWTNISPASSVQFPNSLEFGKDLFFVDPSNGWIVRNSLGSGEAIVLRTIDGGLTWKMSSLPETSTVSAIYFKNQEYGWILTEGSDGVKTLYLTVNGGAAWRKMMSSPVIPDHTENELALPKNGHAVGMTFTTANDGYITMLDNGLPKLYITKNGGSQWTENQNFFNPSKYTKCKSFIAGAPTFFGDSADSGYVSVGCSKDDSTKFNGYFTKDSGATWSLAPFALPWQSGVNEEQTPAFLNDQVGWSIQGMTVLHTTNQGKDWVMLPKSEKLTEVLLEYNEVVKLQFYSERVGWLLVSKSDQKRSLLLQTIDGGVSWRVL
ncbi:Ycf48-like protein [compost metagenome]